VHFHVPLYFPGDATLQTTAGLLDDRVLSGLLAAGVRHFEIETYTFHVLPETLRTPDLATSIAREYTWLLGALKV
jgi:hypothetical protein